MGLCLAGLLGFRMHPLSRNEKAVFALFILFYASTCISWIYSTNSNEALRKLVLKLPVLFFPLVYSALRNVGYAARLKLVSILAYTVFLPSAVSAYNYFLNKELFDQLILESKPLPIEFGYGIYHIQFSILLAVSIVLGIYTLHNLFREKRLDAWFWFLGITTVCNLFFIHLLSARTGLAAMYCGLLLLLLKAVWDAGTTLRIALVAGAVILPALLFFVSPSLQKRLSNTVDDLQVVVNGTDANDYSFAMRVAGWHNAIDVIKKHPLTGVGVGDADAELRNNFAEFNPSIQPENRRNPHNQVMETAVQSGVISSMFFLLALTALIFLKPNRSWSYPTAAIVVLMFISSCFESILERQASVVCFSIFLALVYAFNAGRYRIQEE